MGAVCFQLILDPFFNGRVVAAFVHIDKVDHDQTGQIAQTQLAGPPLLRPLGWFLARGLFDRTLFGGTARVDINRNQQRLGHADHQIAT